MMSATRARKRKSTDNGCLPAKLAVRRWLIEKLRAEDAARPLRVFDACHGSGVIWQSLSKSIGGLSILGCDLKGGAATLRIDSRRLLAAGSIDADLYDLDTYGSPFEMFSLLLERAPKHRFGVALTIGGGAGRRSSLASRMSRHDRKVLGLPEYVPPSFSQSIISFCLRDLIGICYNRAESAVEAIGHEAGAAYWGVMIRALPE